MDQRAAPCRGCGARVRRLTWRTWRNDAVRLRASCLVCGKFAAYLPATAYPNGAYHLLDLLVALEAVGVEIRSFRGRIQWRGNVRNSGHLLGEVCRRRADLLRVLRPCPAN
jgi:hypothetical protein